MRLEIEEAALQKETDEASVQRVMVADLMLANMIDRAVEQHGADGQIWDARR